jgi:hypothetical protein
MKEERCYQMKLRGYPWYASSARGVNDGRFLALGLLTTFEHMGYELLGAIDMNTGSGDDGRDSACVPDVADGSGRVVLRGEEGVAVDGGVEVEVRKWRSRWGCQHHAATTSFCVA